MRAISCIVATAALLSAGIGCDSQVKSEELRRCRPEDGSSVSTNEEIQSLAGCQVLEGSLHVSHDVTDLSSLSSLKIIEGSISGGGYQSKPFSLEALHSLEIVRGDLHFLNDNITSFEGPTNLHTVGGWLRLYETPELRNLRGLEKVRSFSRLDIKYNTKLETLDGLDGLEEVEGDVTIKGNELLPSEEVDALLDRIKVGGTVNRD